MKKIKLIYGLEASGGGALKHLVYLVTRLNKDLFKVTVVLSDLRNEDIKVEIKQIKNAGARVWILPIYRDLKPVKDFYVFLKIIFIFCKEKFDIVHAHSSKAGGLFRLAAWICRVPFIFYTPHCFYFQGKSGTKKYFFVLLERLLARLTAKIIVSESEQQEIVKNKIAPVSKVVNINNAIDFSEYRYSAEVNEIKVRLGIKEGTLVVGAVGRLEAQKDWETYVYAANEVLKKYPKTIFLIVGNGKLYYKIQKLVRKLYIEKNIILTGHVKEINKIYEIIDVFVNTSLWEGLPYVLLEAMKFKKPIVATNVGCDSAVIHKETGFISPVKDYKSIAEKIIFLIKNRQMAAKMGEKGVERLKQKYCFDLFVKKHEELYKRTMNNYLINNIL